MGGHGQQRRAPVPDAYGHFRFPQYPGGGGGTYSARDPKHQVRLYINGKEAKYASVEKTSGDHLIQAAKRPLFVSTPEAPLAFEGLIDAVRVYAEALSAAQIQRLMTPKRQ